MRFSCKLHQWYWVLGNIWEAAWPCRIQAVLTGFGWKSPQYFTHPLWSSIVPTSVWVVQGQYHCEFDPGFKAGLVKIHHLFTVGVKGCGMDFVSCLLECTDPDCQQIYTERAQTRLVSKYLECSSSGRVRCWLVSLSPAESGHSCPPCVCLADGIRHYSSRQFLNQWNRGLTAYGACPILMPSISWAVYIALALFQTLPFIIIPVWTLAAAILFCQKHFLSSNWRKASEEWKAENFHHKRWGDIFKITVNIQEVSCERKGCKSLCVPWMRWNNIQYVTVLHYFSGYYYNLKIGTKITSLWSHTLLWQSCFGTWNDLG